MKNSHKVMGEGHEPSARGPTARTLVNDQTEFVELDVFVCNCFLFPRNFVRPEPNEMRRPQKAVGEGHEPSARGPTA